MHESSWIKRASRFADLLADSDIMIYQEVMQRIAAIELRILIVAMGEAIIRRLKELELGEEVELVVLIEKLLDYYYDPISHEKVILDIGDRLKKKYKILFN